MFCLRRGAGEGGSQGGLSVRPREGGGNCTSSFNGLGGGLMVRYDLNERWAVRGDLQYSKRGYKVDNGMIDADRLVDVKVTFHYVDVPVVVEYTPVDLLILQAGLMVGGQVGRALYYDDEKQGRELMGTKQPVDVGAVVGAALNVGNVMLELRYMHQLTRPFKGVDSFKDRALLLSVGYWF